VVYEPWASSPAVRKSMVGNRSRDTKPELALRSAVHAMGLRYRVARPPIKGLRRTADLLFPRQRVVVLLDGCFWHGCPEHYSSPRTNATYWSEKVERNVARDRDTDERLAEAGWTVLRIWEHEDVTDAAERVAALIRERRAAAGGGSAS
jgi:DNA mismatch endonuclease (patch repair protein)